MVSTTAIVDAQRLHAIRVGMMEEDHDHDALHDKGNEEVEGGGGGDHAQRAWSTGKKGNYSNQPAKSFLLVFYWSYEGAFIS